MREIKFRAWSYRNSVMEYPDEGFFFVDGIYSCFTIGGTGEALPCSGDCNVTPESIVFQQYTGLKDKNGVEIYEGDIVKHRVFAHNRPPEYYRTICVTDIRKDYNWLRNNVKGYELYNPKRDPELKVIGNIYENPELIRGDTK